MSQYCPTTNLNRLFQCIVKSIIFIAVWLWNLYNQILINRGILFILYVLKAIIDGLIYKCLANFLVYPFHHQAGRCISPSEPGPKTSCPSPILLFTRFFKTKTTFPPKEAILYFMLWKEKTNSFCEVVIFFRYRLMGKAQSMGVLAMCASWWENTEKGRFPPVCGWGKGKSGPGKYMLEEWRVFQKEKKNGPQRYDFPFS